MSTPAADQFSLSMRSTIRRLSLAGSWMRFCALRKIDAEGAGLPCQLLKHVPVGDLELVAVGVQQPLPGAAPGHDLLRLERSCRPLVRHLQEQQVGQLLGVLDGRDAVVPQDVAERPELVDQAARRQTLGPASESRSPVSRPGERGGQKRTPQSGDSGSGRGHLLTDASGGRRVVLRSSRSKIAFLQPRERRRGSLWMALHA